MSGIDTMDSIRVSIMIAEDYDVEKNSLINIIEKIISRKTINFCLYMTIRFTEVTNFNLKFHLIKLLDDGIEISGFSFAEYVFDSDIIKDKVSSNNVEQGNIRLKGRWDKLIFIKKFFNIPLDGPGNYVILVSLAEEGGQEKGKRKINYDKILDSWQFEAV